MHHNFTHRFISHTLQALTACTIPNLHFQEKSYRDRMEELGSERGEYRRTQREQERERRRIRDRQRRQAMTQEQRERHLARRRRNYQLRRLRAANARFLPHASESSNPAEASSSDEHQRVTSSSDCRVLCDAVSHDQNGQERLNLQSINNGGSVHLEALTYEPNDLPKRVRLIHVRRLARSLAHSISNCNGNEKLQVEVMANDDVSAAGGGTRKFLRLIHIKNLARSMYCSSRETATQSQNVMVQVEQKLPQEGVQSSGKLLWMTSEDNKVAQNTNSQPLPELYT